MDTVQLPFNFPRYLQILCFKAVAGIDVACLQYYGFFGHFSNAWEIFPLFNGWSDFLVPCQYLGFKQFSRHVISVKILGLKFGPYKAKIDIKISYLFGVRSSKTYFDNWQIIRKQTPGPWHLTSDPRSLTPNSWHNVSFLATSLTFWVNYSKKR